MSRMARTFGSLSIAAARLLHAIVGRGFLLRAGVSSARSADRRTPSSHRLAEVGAQRLRQLFFELRPAEMLAVRVERELDFVALLADERAVRRELT